MRTLRRTSSTDSPSSAATAAANSSAPGSTWRIAGPEVVVRVHEDPRVARCAVTVAMLRAGPPPARRPSPPPPPRPPRARGPCPTSVAPPSASVAFPVGAGSGPARPAAPPRPARRGGRAPLRRRVPAALRGGGPPPPPGATWSSARRSTKPFSRGDPAEAGRLAEAITTELESGRQAASQAAAWPPGFAAMSALDRVLLAFEAMIDAKRRPPGTRMDRPPGGVRGGRWPRLVAGDVRGRSRDAERAPRQPAAARMRGRSDQLVTNAEVRVVRRPRCLRPSPSTRRHRRCPFATYIARSAVSSESVAVFSSRIVTPSDAPIGHLLSTDDHGLA